jgi:hypothetical protein
MSTHTTSTHTQVNAAIPVTLKREAYARLAREGRHFKDWLRMELERYVATVPSQSQEVQCANKD